MNDRDRAKHAATHRRELVSKAKAGNVDAGKALLQHAMSAMLRLGPSADEADAVALEWIAQGISDFLSGVPIDRALAVERQGGRPGKSGMLGAIENAAIWNEVHELQETLTTQGLVNPKMRAVARAASNRGVSKQKIRAALKAHEDVQKNLAKQIP